MFNLYCRNVYLDHNATTHVGSSVRKTMRRVLKYQWGNPSAGYRRGKAAFDIVENAREQVAGSVHAHPHEIYFTSCATEANNAVLKTLSNHFFPEKKKIISSPTEHPSVMNTLDFLETQGVLVQYCPVDRFGFVRLEELEKLMDDDTFLICCMYANNETGTIQNIRKISALAKSRNILVMSDCVQALGKIPVDVKELGVDFATFSAHKLYGPKGAGALYARITAPMFSFIHGGHQEEGYRAGTEPVHNIAGFGKACRQVEKLITRQKTVAGIKEHFIGKLRTVKPDIVVNSPAENCLPNTISITFPDISSRELMMMLDYHGISVSSGSACSTHVNKPSHVLKAIGLSDKATEETIRFSFGKETSFSDIRYVLRILRRYLKKDKD